jgi:Bacterial SH3 domain
LAAPGDVHKVTAERANLRAGPSDKTEALGQVQRGDELIELQMQGDWLGVRVVRTGEEGWIYANLIQLTSATRLGRETAPAGFKDLSPGFDSLVRSIEQRYGYQMIDRVETTENRTLRVIPTREWLVYSGRQDHLFAALAIYEMWKNNQKDQPVNLSLMDEKGGRYITISDAASGPSLTIHPLGRD